MRRILPKSLLGQMLLAVALALLVAQLLSGILLFRAEMQRRETGIINSLAFQLIADPRLRIPPPPDAPHRRARHGFSRIQRSANPPDIGKGLRDTEREERLHQVLQSQGVNVDQLIVFTRPVLQDPYALRLIQHRGRFAQERYRRWRIKGDLLVAALKRKGQNDWEIVREPLPGTGPQRFGWIVFQTLVLYVVLVGGLALLLLRITRPLAALTERVERFGETRATDGQLRPSGPDDTRRLIEAHNRMEARIANLIGEKDVMLGAIGHDLKTPLAALRVRIESVEDEAERARMAATIEDITSTLDDILSLARVGRPSDPLERTELSALVASVVEEYEDMGDPVTLDEGPRMAAPVRATWLRRALRNLIGNALRYGKRARVAAEREDGHAVIRVEDDGPGIPDGDLAAMLEPFTRGEASRNRETGGAGLGLTLARAIAEQHGGTLTLANRRAPDGTIAGLVAELRLPLNP